MRSISTPALQCTHCGEDCTDDSIRFESAVFCCAGCRSVYQLLNQQGLCAYYELNDQPGVNQRVKVRKDKFAFLDDVGIIHTILSFKNDTQSRVIFYLPQIHCSSCLYLLENLHKLHPGVVSSRVEFTTKEVDITFHHREVSLREVAELLTHTGYEPYISLANTKAAKPKADKQLVYQLGIAGFCFANIMLLSFPEYLGLERVEAHLQHVFRLLNFILSLPVVLYSAQAFYISAWKSLRHRFLNIDAPIALAILITFGRSVYEVFSGTGGGYFDSMTGIVFFMLAGKVLQDKTYRQLSFERDYTSYFPVAVTLLKEEVETPVTLPSLKAGDTMLIHSEELIPADGILTRGKALIDYSFVTGESVPVLKEMGELVYAGGRQKGGNIEILVTREVAQSYLTQLWHRDVVRKKHTKEKDSFLHSFSRYFTFILFSLVAITAVYWGFRDPSKIWNAVTAMLIVACPCALLLSGTFTNGNILRILGRNHFYLRDAQAIEDIATIDHVVFDKTGTLTAVSEMDIVYDGKPLSKKKEQVIAALASQSSHPLSRALAGWLPRDYTLTVQGFREIAGKGIEGYVDGVFLQLGSGEFIKGHGHYNHLATRIFVSWDEEETGYFAFSNHYREEMPQLTAQLQKHYKLSVVTGDNKSEEGNLRNILGPFTPLHFNQQPEDKLQHVQRLQEEGHRVMMIGDGLNDAGALKQSDAGIALAEDTNNFTPACDGILEARQLPKLPKFIYLCKANRRIIIASFVLSILYNIVGLSFAMQGTLSPLIAAILMPSSSLSILLITFGSSNVLAKWLKL